MCLPAWPVMCWGERTTVGGSSPCLQCRSRNWTRVIRMGSKCPYQLSHLVSPITALTCFRYPVRALGSNLHTRSLLIPPRAQCNFYTIVRSMLFWDWFWKVKILRQRDLKETQKTNTDNNKTLARRHKSHNCFTGSWHFVMNIPTFSEQS